MKIHGEIFIIRIIKKEVEKLKVYMTVAILMFLIVFIKITGLMIVLVFLKNMKQLQL